jgi:hypothetical protein
MDANGRRDCSCDHGFFGFFRVYGRAGDQRSRHDRLRKRGLGGNDLEWRGWERDRRRWFADVVGRLLRRGWIGDGRLGRGR